jgi:CHAD domain-containing protein
MSGIELTSTTERERKYETADAAPPPELTGPLTEAGPVVTVRDQGTTHLSAVYYDTPDERLAADGITLRRRTGGHDAGWHLKLPVASGVREELQAPLSDGLPTDMAALVRSRTRRAELRPVVTLHTERELRQLNDEAGHALAELAIDRVTAERGERAAEWTEVEVELAADADPGLLDAVEERLTAAGLRRSAAASKLHRALAETAPEPAAHAPAAHDHDRAKGTAGAHVLAYARRQLRAIVELDPAVRREQPDAVHQMRVATRRLRSCLTTYRTVIDRDATRGPGTELRWLAAELGADRDREVLADRLGARLDELPPKLRRGPLRRRLRSVTRAHRADTRKQLIAALDSPRYLALLDTLEGLLAEPSLRKAASRPARKVLDAAVRRDRKRLTARVDAALALPAGPERDAALHEARKAAKRARYAAEAARKALGKPAKARIARFTEVQQVLGEHQDSVLAREALLRIATEAQRTGEPSFSYGVLYEREAALAAASERTVAGLRP